MRAPLLLALLVPASALTSPVVLRFRALERPLVLESRFRRVRAGLVDDTRLPPDTDEAQEQLVRIQREDPGGGLEVRVKSMSRRVKIDGEEVTESYEALTAGDPGKVDVFRIDALGRVRKELQGTPPADWLTLPPFPVSPGETWRGSLGATKGRPFEIPLHFRLEEVERVRGAQRARIRVASKGEQAVQALGGQVQWKIEGMVLFDLTRGCVLEDRGRQSYQVRYGSDPAQAGLAYRIEETHRVRVTGLGE